VAAADLVEVVAAVLVGLVVVADVLVVEALHNE
jgi:hypothetical protein